MLDYAEHMLHFGPGTVAFPIERPVLPTQLMVERPLARYWPRLAGRLRLGLAFLTDICLVSVNLFLLSVSALLHNRRIMDLRRDHHRRMHEAVYIRIHMGLPAKRPWTALFRGFISGSRCFASFLVDRGTEIIGAPTIGPVWTIRWCALRWSRTKTKNVCVRLCRSSLWRNVQIVVSSGTRPLSTRANTRTGITSYRASSMAGSEYPNHCCIK